MFFVSSLSLQVFLDSGAFHFVDFLWKLCQEESVEGGGGAESTKEEHDSEVDSQKPELISDTYRLDTTPLFLGKLSCSMKLKKLKGVKGAFVEAKLSQALLSDELMRLYVPA
jgi:hypothetical protein